MNDIAAAAREQMERAEAVIGTDLDPEAPERGWEIHEPDDALKITASDDTTHSSDTPSDDRVQMIEVRPGETRPMLDGLYDVTLPASGRPGLTLREAAIEAILIREQDTAFSVVARHIAALFTSLDAIPSAPPVPSEASGRTAPTPFETFQAGMAAGLLSTRHALIHDYTEDEVRQEFRDWLDERAADRGEPT